MKQKRQLEILKLIEKEEIKTQTELSNRLKNMGYKVTQATVSRDICELKLLKVPANGGGSKYGFSGSQIEKSASNNFSKLNTIMAEAVLSCDYANNIIIVKTMQGMAQGVAFVIDALHDSSVMGSIAGDDTIIVVSKTEESASNLTDVIRKML